MVERVLILVLGALVVALATSIIIRRKRNRKLILLNEEAVDELVKAIINNINAGAIQDIAGRVSDILKRHLECERILFMRYYKGRMEVNYLHGMIRVDRAAVSFKLTPEIQGKLKAFGSVAKVERLKDVIPESVLKGIMGLELPAFFPIYLRDNLYGIYFIKTKLPTENRELQFLSTALAFNLSTAYHIGIQEKQLKKFEERLRTLQSERDKVAPKSNVMEEKTGLRGEMPRLLRIKNCEKLVPELMHQLRKDCAFSKMAFYAPCEKGNDVLIAVNWNIAEECDKSLRGKYNRLVTMTSGEGVLDLKEGDHSKKMGESEIAVLKKSELRYLSFLPWTENKKAILLWNGEKSREEMTEKLKRFQSEAMPLLENARRYERIEELSYTDGLTGIHNFRFFRERLEEELQRAKRYNRSLALLILDIDNLKVINDKYGHLAGDAILKAFAKILCKSVRSIDVASRYGGDEFCLIIPEADREKARLFMERFRVKISSESASGEGLSNDYRFSVSIGGAVYPDDATEIDELINAADMALLQAKEEGGNLTRLYQPEYQRPAVES